MLLITAGLAAGCQSATKITPYENDPLVMSKKPVEGTLEPHPGTPVASAEPTAPLAPLLPHGPDSVASKGIPAQPVALLKAPVILTPAIRVGPEGEEAIVFGHASDLSWLRGVLDRHFDGHFELRYSAHTIDDRWGGKVRLEDDPKLAGFRDGDVIRVEGALVPGESPVAWDQAPRYKAWAFQLVRESN